MPAHRPRRVADHERDAAAEQGVDEPVLGERPAGMGEQVDQHDHEGSLEDGEEPEIPAPPVGQQRGQHRAGNQQQRAVGDNGQDRRADDRPHHRAGPALDAAREH